MARPRVELTARELEIMHLFWNRDPATAAEVREALEASGRDLAYTTVATLIRILCEKKYLQQTNAERPFVYRPARSFEDVSQHLLGDLIHRVFKGSRKQLLLRLVEQKKLSAAERAILKDVLREGGNVSPRPDSLVVPVAGDASRRDRHAALRGHSPHGSTDRRMGLAAQPVSHGGPVAGRGQPLAAVDPVSRPVGKSG